MSDDDLELSSHRPYLIRAIREWAIDNNLTPQLVVNASFAGVKVPDEFIEDGQIILNVSPQAVSHLEMGNELISFSARFRRVARSVEVPVDAVLAVFDRETRQGMSFPGVTDDEDVADDAPDSQPPARGKPKLKLVE